MTQDDVIVLWKDANGWDVRGYKNTLGDLERFAHLVAAKSTEEANAKANASWTLMCKKMVAIEREACAKVCDEKVDAEYATGKVDHNEMGWTQSCAIAIRARGEQA
jgi:hypothetical protein